MAVFTMLIVSLSESDCYLKFGLLSCLFFLFFNRVWGHRANHRLGAHFLCDLFDSWNPACPDLSRQYRQSPGSNDALHLQTNALQNHNTQQNSRKLSKLP